MFSFSEGAIWLGFYYQLQQLGWYSFLFCESVCVCHTDKMWPWSQYFG